MTGTLSIERQNVNVSYEVDHISGKYYVFKKTEHPDDRVPEINRSAGPFDEKSTAQTECDRLTEESKTVLGHLCPELKQLQDISKDESGAPWIDHDGRLIANGATYNLTVIKFCPMCGSKLDTKQTKK